MKKFEKWMLRATAFSLEFCIITWKSILLKYCMTRFFGISTNARAILGMGKRFLSISEN